MTARNLRMAAVLLVTLASLAWALWGIEIDKVADAVYDKLHGAGRR